MSEREDAPMASVPHATDAEGALLGAALIDPHVMDEVVLPAKAFFHPRHQWIWAAMRALHDEKGGYDILTVAERLRSDGHLEDVGGKPYLLQLSALTPSSANAEYYAELVSDTYLRRRAIAAAEYIVKGVRDGDDPLRLLDKAVEVLNSEAAGVLSADHLSVGDAIAAALMAHDEAAKRARAGLSPSSAPVGLPSIDASVVNRPGDLIIPVARPKTGKSMFALWWALQLARQGQRVLFVSLEMTVEQIGERLASMVSGVPMNKVRYGALTDQERAQIEKVQAALAGLPLVLVERPGLTIHVLRGELTAARSLLGGVDAVFVDYLGLLGVPGAKNEYERLSKAVVGLKRMALRYKVVMVAPHQLSRANETSATNRPRMHQIHGSGILEQTADKLIAIYEPDREVLGLSANLLPRVVEVMANRQGVSGVGVMAAIDTTSMRWMELAVSPMDYVGR